MLKNKIFRNLLLPTIVISSIALFYANTEVNQQKKEAALIGSIKEILDAYHFSPQLINDSLSAHTFDLYLKNLDYNKLYLTKSDYDILKTYRFKIDDEINLQSYDFFNLSTEIINNRINNTKGYYEEILLKPFDYKKDEVLNIDPETISYAKDEDELKDRWRKILKHQTILKISSLEKTQKSDKEKNDTVILKSFEELEKEAREKTKKNYDSKFKYLDQINRQDRLTIYINSIINYYDPHTGYFPPKDKEDFDITISGKLEGIGATLTTKDGYIKVVRIVPGSASWRQGELKAEDIILKVGQGDEEPVDVVDMRLDEAVKLIRGPKDSKVILTVKKIDGSIVEIPIIRDVVVLEETFAKSTIITDQDKSKRIGYIYLPRFYMDFNNSNGRKCSEDIKKEIEKLKTQNVDGIIFDLRNNGGGSLRDVVKIGGFFIDKGPIVQVKQKNSKAEILSDTDPATIYDGPLIVMVNSQSASASEILAAAMQDYKRAVIVGTKSSYGKGTVQRFVDIDMFLPKEYSDIKPLGHLKITIQKFYRINGGATQLRGVTPDIVLPDKYSYIEIGEKELDYPLKWDEIPAVEYNIWTKPMDITRLQKRSQKRQETDSLLIYIEDAAQKLKAQRDKEQYPLEYDKHKEEEAKNEEISKYIGQIGKTETPLEIDPILFKFLDTVTVDTLKKQRIDNWHKKIKKDEQLYETYNIMLDLL